MRFPKVHDGCLSIVIHSVNHGRIVPFVARVGRSETRVGATIATSTRVSHSLNPGYFAAARTAAMVSFLTRDAISSCTGSIAFIHICFSAGVGT